MATSVSRLHAQIAKLQQQADALKQAAVKRVQREIELHGLTVDDLFGGGTSVGGGQRAKSSKAVKARSTKSAKAPKFGDSAGNTWGGMGKRPQWLKDALEGGASLEDFLLGASAAKPTASAGAKRARKAAPAGAKKASKKSAAAGGAKKPAAKTSAKRKARAAAEPSDAPA
jgi:DNA-binding protein H-NS